MSERLTEAASAVADLAQARGIGSIKDKPQPFKLVIDERWTVYVNAGQAAVKLDSGADLEPFNFYVEFNGWPAAMFSPFAGSFVAGEGANEETFLAACRAAQSAAEVQT